MNWINRTVLEQHGNRARLIRARRLLLNLFGGSLLGLNSTLLDSGEAGRARVANNLSIDFDHVLEMNRWPSNF